MIARVVVRQMPGSSRPWSALHGYWRWRCEACGDLGHWTTDYYAHDDGRDHAAHCGALKYAQLTRRLEVAQSFAAVQMGVPASMLLDPIIRDIHGGAR